jgi:hypothetical protein
VSSTAAQAATSYTGVFRGRPDQVGRARHAIIRHLAGHPAADDAALIISDSLNLTFCLSCLFWLSFSG